MAIKEFFKKTKLRRIVIPVIIIFMVIVACLAASSAYVNNKAYSSVNELNKVSSTEAVDPSSKTILQFSEDSSEETLKYFEDEKYDYTKIGSDIYIVNCSSPAQANSLTYEKYSNNENVLANEDYIFQLSSTSEQEAVKDFSYEKPNIPEGMSLREYADSTGKKIVAVIDTGVDSKYAVQSVNFTTDSADDSNGHGTSVAKAILSESNGEALILSIKAMHDSGTGYLSDVLQGLEYAKSQNADFVNLSIAAEDLGGTEIFKQEVKTLVDSGIKVVASAGNFSQNSKNYIPANIEGVESIGAYYTDESSNKFIQKSSNYNATYYEEASSTSIAAAIHTGKLVRGETEFVKESDLNGIKDDLSENPSYTLPILSKTGVDVYSNEDGTEAKTVMSYNINLSSEAKSEIYATKGIAFVTSPVQLEKNKYNCQKEIYDSVTGYYHYVYLNENDMFNDISQMKAEYHEMTFFTTYIPELFQIQGDDYTWGNSSEIGVVGRHQWGEGTGIWADKTPYNGTSHNKTIQFSLGAKSSGDGSYSWELQGVGWYSEGKVNANVSMLDGYFPVTVKSETDNINIYTQSPKLNTYLGTWKTMCNGSSTTKGDSNGNVKLKATIDLRGIRSYDQAVNTGNGYCDAACMYFWSNSDYATCSVTIRAVSTYNLKVSPNGGILVGGNFGSKNNTNQDADVTVTYGTSYYIYPLGTAKKEGYIFKGFYTATSGGSQIIKSDGYVANDGTYCSNNLWKYSGNLNIYAQWDEIQYSVKYNVNGGTGTVASQDNKKYTDKFNLQTNTFKKTGYLFDGWYLNPECTGTKYTEGQQVSKLSATNGATVTFYAKWVPIKYNVEFNANGGRHVRNNANDRKDYNVERTDEAVQLVGGKTASQTQTYDSAARLTGNGFTWEGHTFLGWSKDPNATSATWKDGDFASDSKTSKGGLTVNSNETVTLYAIWKADEHTVTINPVKGNGTWNSAGDPNQSGSASPKKGEDSVTKDGSGNTKWGDKIILGEAIPDNKDATVTYDVNTDEAVTIDKTSETVHWKFSKWTTDRKNGNKELLHNNSARANDGSHDNGEQTYYILQDTNDTVTANYYMQAVTLPTPTRDGYTFLGWYYDAACTDKVDGRGAGGTKYPLDANGEEMKAEYQTRGNGGDTFRTDGDVTIYARWQKNSYNYADTEQVFMQDDENKKNPGDFSVKIRKVDANTRQPLVEKNGESFVLGIYKGSVSDRNLLYRLDTAKGIYKGNTTEIVMEKTTVPNGWYDITELLKTVSGYDSATFIVHEISAPKGWSIAKDQSFKIIDDVIQITVKDEKYTPPVKNYFKKVDSQGRAVSNVTFELQDVSDGNKVVWTGTTNSKGTFDYEKNPDTGKYDISFYSFCKAGHTYSLVEKKAPEGFKLGNPVTFKVPATGAWTPDTIEYVDNIASAKLKVRKLNSDDKPLKGAVFQLYMKEANGTLVPCYMGKTTLKWVEADGESDTVSIMTATTDDDGNAYFDGLPLRALFTGSEPDCTKSYYLKEIQAPEGYSLLTDIAEIRLPADGDGKTIEFTAKDDSVTLTLEAGGSGCYMYYGLGIVMTAIALCLAVYRKKNI